MSDLIRREDAIAVLMETMTPSPMLDTLVLRMEELPYEDYMKVVRCKDCTHNHVSTWNHGKRDNPQCHFTDLVRSPEFYCAFGVCPNCGADMRGADGKK